MDVRYMHGAMMTDWGARMTDRQKLQGLGLLERTQANVFLMLTHWLTRANASQEVNSTPAAAEAYDA